MNALPDIFPLISDSVSRHGTPWSDYEDRWIVWLRRERKLAAGAIAPIVGRSVATVYARFRILDAKLYERVDWDAAEFARAKELLEDRSMTIGDIAKALGRTETSLRAKLDYEGVKPHRMDRASVRSAAGDGKSETMASRKAAETMERLRARLAGVETREAADPIVEAFALEIGVTARVMFQKARREGLIAKKRAQKGFDAAKIAWARELAAAGETITSAAALLRSDIRTLKAIAVREDIVFQEADRVARAMAGRLARTAKAAAARAAAKSSVRIALPAPTVSAARVKPSATASFQARPKVAPAPLSAQPKVAPKAELRDLAARAVEGRTIQRIPAEVPSVRPAARPLALTKATPVVLPAQPKVAQLSPASPKVARVVPPAPPRVAPVALPAQPRGVVASRPAAPRSFASPPARDAGHEKALALRAGMDDAIARFLAERGATRPVEDHGVEGVVKAIRARGYSVVRTGIAGEAGVGSSAPHATSGATVGSASINVGASKDSGFLIDGRISIANEAALRAFAEARDIRAP